MVKYVKIKLALISFLVVSMLLMSAVTNAESLDNSIGNIDTYRISNSAIEIPANLGVDWIPEFDDLDTKLGKHLAGKVDNQLSIRKKEIENLYGDVIVATAKDHWHFESDSLWDKTDEKHAS